MKREEARKRAEDPFGYGLTYGDCAAQELSVKTQSAGGQKQEIQDLGRLFTAGSKE